MNGWFVVERISCSASTRFSFWRVIISRFERIFIAKRVSVRFSFLRLEMLVYDYY